MPGSLAVLITAEQLNCRVEELAALISEDYQGCDVLLVGVLKGSYHFLSDLARYLSIEAQVDFLQTSSYHAGKSSSGIVQIRKDLDINI